MALIKCKECGKEISDKSKNCVACGCPTKLSLEAPKEPIKKEIIEEDPREDDSIICEECSHKLKKNDSTCVYCGYDKEKEESKKKSTNFIYIFGSLILFLCLIAILSTTKVQFGTNSNEVNQSNVRDTSVPQIEIIEEYINIRKEKAVSSDQLGQVKKGEIYTIINEYPETAYHWYEIKTSNGIHGYIAGQSDDVEYVKVLYYNPEQGQQEDTNQTSPENESSPENNNSYNNSNNNYNSNPSAGCNEAEKQRITNEYNATVQQKTTEYEQNKAQAEQQINVARELMEINGGYLSYEEYQAKYSEAQSDTYRKLLDARYGASQEYDKMVNTYNQLDPAFQNWKDSYAAWYYEALRNINC